MFCLCQCFRQLEALLGVMHIGYTGSLVYSSATLHCLLPGKALCCHNLLLQVLCEASSPAVTQADSEMTNIQRWKFVMSGLVCVIAGEKASPNTCGCKQWQDS